MSMDGSITRWSEIFGRPDQVTFLAEDENGSVVGLADGGPERPGRADFSGEFHAVHLLEKARRNDFRRSAAISCKDLRCQIPTQNFARFRQIRGKLIRSKIKTTKNGLGEFVSRFALQAGVRRRDCRFGIREMRREPLHVFGSRIEGRAA
jgi:hypothetical protein